MRIKNFSELHELFKQGAVSQEEYNDLKLKIMQNSKSGNYKFKFILVVLIFVCGVILGDKIVGYVIPYYWQAMADYDGEDVCISYMQVDGNLYAVQDNGIKGLTERKQACKCLHDITVKNEITDFRGFVEFIAKDNNVYKGWLRKKLVGKKSADENGFIKVWLKYWFRNDYINCE